MNLLLWTTAATAALIFVSASATTNALFLASLGRTDIEAGIYVAISVAADLAKVVLPVALARAVVARAWAQATLSALLLTGVIALSVSSGSGFAAMTRGTVSDGRAARAAQLAALQSEAEEIRQRLFQIRGVREAAIIAAALEATKTDHRWQSSRGCAEATVRSSRAFCSGVAQLHVEAASAGERERLRGEERRLRSRIEALRTSTSTAVDPQAEAIATLLGLDWQRLRAGFGLGLALVLELGSVVLILLLAGPLLRRPETPERQPQAAEPPVPFQLPPQRDRIFWHRQRELRAARAMGGGHDGA